MKYKIAKSVVSQENIRDYSKLLSKVFSKTNKYTPEFLRWQYGENPIGTIVGSDAYFNDELVAHYATIPVVYNIFEKQTKGLLSINTATHPNHIGRGLFTKLGNTTFENAKQLKYEFVIGVSNQNSTYVFVNKFNFTLLWPLCVKIGIGQIIPCNPSIHKIYPHWNDKLLSWRLRNPSTKYYRTNKTIVSCTDIPGIYAQLQNNDGNSQQFLSLKQKHTLIILWIGNSKTKNTKGLFFDIPNKLKPSPLNLIFKDLTGKIGPFKKENIFFQLIDFDVY